MLVVKQQQGMPASIFGNNEQHSQLQTGKRIILTTALLYVLCDL